MSDVRPCRRGRSRSRARGAVLTEAIIVIAFFVIVFGCGSFVHRLYASKLRATRRSREQAWTLSMQACAGGGAVADKALGSSLHPDTERLFGAVRGMDLLGSPVVAVRQENGARVTVSGGLGLAPADVRSTLVLTCNERVLDTDPNDAAEIAWRALTGW